eukprot:994048-Rhodomonas_salina.2
MGCGVRVCLVAWEQSQRAHSSRPPSAEPDSRPASAHSKAWVAENGRGMLAGEGGALGWGMTLGYRCAPVGAGATIG